MLGDEETEVLGLATKSSDFSYEGLYAQVQVVSRIYSYENTFWVSNTDIVGRQEYSAAARLVASTKKTGIDVRC